MPFYPPMGFHFKVEIKDFEGEAAFKSVSGLKVDIPTTVTVEEGGENTFTHQLPTRLKYGDLTLERGLLVGSALIGWFNDAVQNFEFDPKDVTVTLLTGEHTPLDQWVFRNAYPKSWAISNFDAQDSNKVATDTIVLAYQYFYRVGMPARPQSLTPKPRT